MRSVPYLTLFIAFLFFCFDLNAQPDSADKAHFKMGVFYNTNLNYYGRTDSLQSSGFFPLAELWITRNFYINAAPVFVNNSIQHFEYAGTVATAGFQFNDGKKWAGNFYVVRPFYRNNSQLVQSALKAQVAGTLTYQDELVNITAGADIKISDKTDIGATAGLDHIFRAQLSKASVLVIDPSAYINAGTQQFTTTSYKKNNFLLLPGNEQAVSETTRKFAILSYELSAPIIFATGKLQLLLIPAFVSPQHLVSVPGRADLSEHGENLFYVTAGAKITL